MEEIQLLGHGFAVALQWENVLLMVAGIVLGVLIGVLPGLGGANGIAILLPLTFTLPPVSAIILLSCIYWGALFGGPSPPSCSTSRASHGASPPPSTAIRWRSRAARARR
nr:tripartite tricarboxylate transporter permease [Roseococcus microcysteis]